MPDTRFHNIDQEFAGRIASDFTSPVYLMDEVLLAQRFEEMQTSAKAAYANSAIAISYKTNPTRSLLAELHKRGGLAEVVSTDEYQIALSLGVDPRQIVFNGPAKSDQSIQLAIQRGSYLHCDHEDEVVRVERIARSMDCVARIGVRLYFPSDESWERFGFWADHLDGSCPAFSIIRRIVASDSLKLAGLHSHIGTNVRDLAKFQRFAKVYVQFAEAVRDREGIELDWIDVGGGLAGIAPRVDEHQTEPHPLPSIVDYVSAITEPLKPYLESCSTAPALLYEPGRTLFNAAGGLLTTVVGRRSADSDGVESVILNAGVTSLAFAFKYDCPVHLCRRCGSEAKHTVRLLGPTCMEQDVVSRPIELPALEIGDHLVIFGTGCYSMALASSFTHFRLGVVGWGERDQLRWLRRPETLEHSRRLDVFEPFAESSDADV